MTRSSRDSMSPSPAWDAVCANSPARSTRFSLSGLRERERPPDRKSRAPLPRSRSVRSRWRSWDPCMMRAFAVIIVRAPYPLQMGDLAAAHFASNPHA